MLWSTGLSSDNPVRATKSVRCQKVLGRAHDQGRRKQDAADRGEDPEVRPIDSQVSRTACQLWRSAQIAMPRPAATMPMTRSGYGVKR